MWKYAAVVVAHSGTRSLPNGDEMRTRDRAERRHGAVVDMARAGSRHSSDVGMPAVVDATIGAGCCRAAAARMMRGRSHGTRAIHTTMGSGDRNAHARGLAHGRGLAHVRGRVHARWSAVAPTARTHRRHCHLAARHHGHSRETAVATARQRTAQCGWRAAVAVAAPRCGRRRR